MSVYIADNSSDVGWIRTSGINIVTKKSTNTHNTRAIIKQVFIFHLGKYPQHSASCIATSTQYGKANWNFLVYMQSTQHSWDYKSGVIWASRWKFYARHVKIVLSQLQPTWDQNFCQFLVPPWSGTTLYDNMVTPFMRIRCQNLEEAKAWCSNDNATLSITQTIRTIACWY